MLQQYRNNTITIPEQCYNNAKTILQQCRNNTITKPKQNYNTTIRTIAQSPNIPNKHQNRNLLFAFLHYRNISSTLTKLTVVA